MIPMFMSYDNEMQNKSSLAGNFQSFRIFRQIEIKFMLASAAAAIQVFRNKKFMFDEIFQKLPIFTHIPSFFFISYSKNMAYFEVFYQAYKKERGIYFIVFQYHFYV